MEVSDAQRGALQGVEIHARVIACAFLTEQSATRAGDRMDEDYEDRPAPSTGAMGTI